jgi:hypothetical protein
MRCDKRACQPHHAAGDTLARRSLFVLCGAPLLVTEALLPAILALAMTLSERLDIYEKLMRLDGPIGILLLLWPTLWGLWLASGLPNPWTPRFSCCVVLMRSAIV